MKVYHCGSLGFCIIHICKIPLFKSNFSNSCSHSRRVWPHHDPPACPQTCLFCRALSFNLQWSRAHGKWRSSPSGALLLLNMKSHPVAKGRNSSHPWWLQTAGDSTPPQYSLPDLYLLTLTMSQLKIRNLNFYLSIYDSIFMLWHVSGMFLGAVWMFWQWSLPLLAPRLSCLFRSTWGLGGLRNPDVCSLLYRLEGSRLFTS